MCGPDLKSAPFTSSSLPCVVLAYQLYMYWCEIITLVNNKNRTLTLSVVDIVTALLYTIRKVRSMLMKWE